MRFALQYAADGFAVFPCRPKGKEPLGSLVSNGCLDATTDAKIIKGWWTRCPNANIGLATGVKNGLAVVDLDGDEGLRSGNSLKMFSTIISLTGGGKQLFYADPEGKLKNSVKKLAAGVDTRGIGGYVVVPPSLHPNGKRYVWASQPLARTHLSPLPTLFLSEIPVSPQSTLRKPDSWMSAALDELKKGHVHNTLISVLGKFRTHGFTEEDTYKLLQPYALENGRPFDGLRDKINEIWKRYQPGLAVAGPSRSETIDAFLGEIKEPEWICPKIISRQSIGFVVGLPATLKTWCCIDLALECAREEAGLWLGLFQTKSSKVLFIDQERWRGESQRRFGSLMAAKGLSRSALKDRLYMKCGTTIRLNLDSSYQAFRTELLEMRPTLVIVDSFATFHTLPENDRTEIQKVLERIKELRNDIGCTFLFINHESKMAYANGEPQGDPTPGTMVGSIGISAAAEFILTVRKIDENTSMVWQTKSTLAEPRKPFYVTIKDIPEGIVVAGLDK